MHDTPEQTHWHELRAGENAGFGKFLRKPMPYDSFMEAEGVPVFRGIGVRRVQDLPMKPWARLGGRGSYIQLFGTERDEPPRQSEFHLQLSAQFHRALLGR